MAILTLQHPHCILIIEVTSKINHMLVTYYNPRRFLTILCWLCSWPLLYGESLEVDTNVVPSKQPKVVGGSHNIPVIDIAKPSEAGVSHNVFSEYNVDERGIIYNNNPDLELTAAHVEDDRLGY